MALDPYLRSPCLPKLDSFRSVIVRTEIFVSLEAQNKLSFNGNQMFSAYKLVAIHGNVAA